MTKIISFLIFGTLSLSNVANARNCKGEVKEFICHQSIYNAEISIRFKKHARPVLISAWKLSQGNISGKPDYLFQGKLKPFSKRNSEIVQYEMKGDFDGLRYLNIFVPEKELANVTGFASNDFLPEDVEANPEFRADCFLKN